jgi:hypothetical protein
MTPEAASERWAAMTPEERLTMAKTAPRVAGPWVTRGTYSERVDFRTGEFLVGTHEGATITRDDQDTALLAAGYVLEGDE